MNFTTKYSKSIYISLLIFIYKHFFYKKYEYIYIQNNQNNSYKYYLLTTQYISQILILIMIQYNYNELYNRIVIQITSINTHLISTIPLLLLIILVTSYNYILVLVYIFTMIIVSYYYFVPSYLDY